jgi:hypothetical protein
MKTIRHKRDVNIEPDVIPDKSDKFAMQLGYAVMRNHPEWLDALKKDIDNAKKECKESYEKRCVENLDMPQL